MRRMYPHEKMSDRTRDQNSESDRTTRGFNKGDKASGKVLEPGRHAIFEIAATVKRTIKYVLSYRETDINVI